MWETVKSELGSGRGEWAGGPRGRSGQQSIQDAGWLGPGDRLPTGSCSSMSTSVPVRLRLGHLAAGALALFAGQCRALGRLGCPGARKEGVVAPFLSSAGTWELLPSRLLLRGPACHWHQHRDRQQRPFQHCPHPDSWISGWERQAGCLRPWGPGPGGAGEMAQERGWATSSVEWDGLQARAQVPQTPGVYGA